MSRRSTLATVLDGMGQSPDAAFGVARIEREREAAARRFVRDRDFRALDGTVARLDAEESEVRAREDSIRPEQAIAWLQNLPALWHAADDSGRRMLTEAIFEKAAVLGSRRCGSIRRPKRTLTGGRSRLDPSRGY